MTSVLDGPRITADMARELALSQKVCIRPLLRRVHDRATDSEAVVALPCGSTREAVCPPCAHKARVLRMQQCQEGWHRTDEPERQPTEQLNEDQPDAEDQGDDDTDRRVRSTRRRQDAPDLPRVPQEDRTIGRVFATPDGRAYRPSMFLTLTMPSYGAVTSSGVPADPAQYNYRRQALDALHFARLVDRFWQNLRRAAGYKVQYFGAVEPQRRLVPHLHAAIRGAIPRATIRQVVAATYLQLWWPLFDRPVYVHRTPVWDGESYVDVDTGEVLPTWDQALDRLAADPDGRPAHVMRFGRQVDMAGIIAPSPDADRAVRYLTKYLTKAVADTHTDPDGEPDPALEAHVDRLHTELRYLPCSERCANWLRYGIQPDAAGPGLQPGRCSSKAHDREHLGLGGRRVLVSRQWSGKRLSEHKADRATVVREALLAAGVVAPETERLAATVTLPDGSPRFVWTDTRPDARTYARVLLQSVAERAAWRAQYEAAKAAKPVDSGPATLPPADPG
ncbi:hypothetical protein SAMN04488543_0213 [Friedmanniella luteola]|uniref:Replication initiation protein n=1 Tax=Friedmanniella luteola TaxID=546871 RepID=A0A1H1LEC7_9ACTN|nr:replication initiator [Friedmanniella luteola]SDR72405.1 hypothetical protein SAMN04488543_0213 [Friedmanniella luteola]